MKIAYKTVAAVLAVAIVVIMVFVPVIYIAVNSAAAQILVYVGQVKGNEYANEIVENNGGETPKYIGLDISLVNLLFEDKELVEGISDLFGEEKSEGASEQVQKLISPGVTFLISYILLAVSAIVTAILAFAAKDNRKVIFSSMAGIGLSFMVKYAFETIAEFFLNGKITITSLVQSMWAAFLGDIEVFKLDNGFWFIPVIFGVIILWTVFYNYTLPVKEKAERKAMLGEETVEVK